MFDDNANDDPIDWGKIASDALTGGLMLAGGYRTVQGYESMGVAAQMSGQRKAQALEFEADQYDEVAGKGVAISQRAAWDERKKGRLAQSRLVAVVSAQGGTAQDVIDLSARISTEAAYRAAVAAYNGLDNARTARLQAAGKRFEAATAREQGDLMSAAYSTMGTAAKVQTATSLAAKYAPEIVGALGKIGGAVVDEVFSNDNPDSYADDDSEFSVSTEDFGFFDWEG